jgi:hypothetical protein
MEVKLPNYVSNKKHIIKVDRWDTWNCDSTIAKLVFPMLLQLKDEKQGVPSEFGEVGGEAHGVQDSFEFYQESYAFAWDEGVKRWDTILEKIIWSMYQIAYVDYDQKYHHGESDYDFSDGKLTQLNSDYWYDAAGAAKHEERIQEGLDLFGKYFRSLWD